MNDGVVRPASEAIGSRTNDGGCEELHRRPDEAEETDDARRVRDVAALKGDDELRQHGRHDPEREHVERDRNEEERERRTGRTDHQGM